MIDQACSSSGMNERLYPYANQCDYMEVKLSKIVNDLGKYAFADDSIALTIFNLGEDHVLKPNCPLLC